MSRPVIGICSATEVVRGRAWEMLCNLSPRTYSNAVQAADAMAILLPPDDATAEEPDQALDLLDGLVLAGGADVDPARYGSVPGPHTVPRPDRDAAELVLLQAALDRDLPLLAICRGMQLLNVTLGGDLLQHLPDVEGAGAHQLAPGLFAPREVRTAPRSELHRLLGPAPAVDCHHHQALARIASGLTPSAWAEDGVVEAVEASGRRFCLGVQWHPEAGEDRRLFHALVAAASKPGR